MRERSAAPSATRSCARRRRCVPAVGRSSVASIASMRGLACAVRPEQTDDGAGRGAERNVRDGTTSSEVARDILDRHGVEVERRAACRHVVVTRDDRGRRSRGDALAASLRPRRPRRARRRSASSSRSRRCRRVSVAVARRCRRRGASSRAARASPSRRLAPLHQRRARRPTSRPAADRAARRRARRSRAPGQRHVARRRRLCTGRFARS